jgi:hypothetical protein
MSIQTLKKKGIITGLGVKISGKPTRGFWVSQGPFGPEKQYNTLPFGISGFSLQGGTRNQGYVGKSYAMSVNGTPFYGEHPIGWGGHLGRYKKSEPVFNMPNVKVDTRGKQYRFIKPSVLSTKGMLEKKYKWINNGTYPNYWVQPVYGNGNLSDNASQQVYIDTLAAKNITVNNTNKPEKFIDYYKRCSGTGCSNTNAKYTSYNIIDSNGQYTKDLYIPQTSSQYTLQIQRKCANPIGSQKPFPFAANNSHTPSIGSLGSSTAQVGATGFPTPLLTPQYLSPPKWYTETECNISNDLSNNVKY